MQPEDRVRLQHMLDAANDAVEFARGQSRRSLDTNRMLTLSIVQKDLPPLIVAIQKALVE